ncbi:MAG: anti-sigma factor [Acidobacteriota bacterium]
MIEEVASLSPDCRRIESLLPPFVDGEATPRDAALVEAHLSGCAECRGSAQEQRQVRALLVSRRCSLAEPTPFGLESRLRRMARAEGADTAVRGWRRLSPLAAAAALVAAVAGGVYWGTGQSAVLLAAQLTLDHIKCFMIDGDDRGQTISTDSAQLRLHESYGLDVHLPHPSAATDAHVVAVRSCLYGEGLVAHVLYRVNGAAVSMFVLPGHDASAVDVTAFGRHAEVVSRGGVTYVLVAPTQLTGVAAAVGLEGE